MTPTILSIEDEQDTSALLKSVLERDGYHVVHAADGRQAICLIETMLPPALFIGHISVMARNVPVWRSR